MALIELDRVCKTYMLGELPLQVLHGISFSMHEGEYIALTGASGSGKSTLMNIIGCLDRLNSGAYRLDGRDVSSLSSDERAWVRNNRIGFVFQNFNLLNRMSALDNVIMPLSYGRTELSREEERERAAELLRLVGLGDRMHHSPSQLSGGQQQRVALARALINRPSLLLADEPTGNLDTATTEEVLALFRRLNEEDNISIMIVTHDADVAAHAKRVIRISDGRVQYDRMNSSEGVADYEEADK